MIDHILGRPDPRFRKYQVLTVLLLWFAYLYKGNKDGPPGLRRFTKLLSKRITPWQTIILTYLTLYFSRNFGRIMGLPSPEPLASMYTREYFRATWFYTALDAGFWSAMNLRPKWLRDIASIGFTAYYLFAAEQADEVARKVRGCINIDFMRISWNKARSPYLALASNLMRPRFMRSPPRKIVIPRPPWSEYSEPISAWLYFDGPVDHLTRHDKIILDVPGGGFVAMDPRCHDDKLLEWAGKSGLPVIALNYRKAPEYPFPYALNECYDAYCELIRTNGRCVGLSGDVVPKIVVSGDSAGGNLATAMVIMLLQSSSHTLYEPAYRDDHLAIPPPEGLVLIYPALDMNMSNWMNPQQIAMVRQRRKTNKGILDRKNEDYQRLQPKTPHGSEMFQGDQDSLQIPPPPRITTSTDLRAQDADKSRPTSRSPALSQYTESSSESLHVGNGAVNGPLSINGNMPKHKSLKERRQRRNPAPFKTSVAMSSMISYFHDRVLAPELMRAMILLYVGEHNQPDFATDYLLSPLLAPDSILARFPKVCLMTGERDPLSDDTVLFAGRLRQAHEQRFLQRQEMGLESSDKLFDAAQHVEYVLIAGISHGFMQFVNFYPTGWKYVEQCRRWMMDMFRDADDRRMRIHSPSAHHATTLDANDHVDSQSESRRGSRHRRHGSENAATILDDPPDAPLEMTRRHRRTSSIPPSGSSLRTPHVDRAGRSAIQKPTIYHSGRRSPTTTHFSLSRLASSENLIDRRMTGLTFGLMGDGSAEELLS